MKYLIIYFQRWSKPNECIVSGFSATEKKMKLTKTRKKKKKKEKQTVCRSIEAAIRQYPNNKKYYKSHY